jgi:RNA 2',3'-cyclic 3'-phosphodiesterase
MRLFIALEIDEAIRERIARFAEGVRNFAPDARWVKGDSLHVTLKFIGEQPDDKVEAIKSGLTTVGATTSEIRFRGYGFFPTPKSARVFWVGMECGPELSALAAAIDRKMSSLDIPKEDRKFSPHLTLARTAAGSGAPRRLRNDAPNRAFQHLQAKLADLSSVPEFGTMIPHEFFLYQSQLSPKGSRYTKLAGFSLRS